MYVIRSGAVPENMGMVIGQDLYSSLISELHVSLDEISRETLHGRNLVTLDATLLST